jgi:hypothetical protein
MAVKMMTDKQRCAIWASANKHGIDSDAVHDIISSVAKKESMKQLNYVEAAKVLDRINNKRPTQKRTDEGGNLETVRLRKKIYSLTGELGWNNDNERINGFVYRMFKINRLEWLPETKCHKLIEILKKMVNEMEENVNGSKEKI